MQMAVAVSAARAVILLGMATWFAITLGKAALGDLRSTQVGPADGNRDPGVRVLLADRSRAAPQIAYERIPRIDVIQPCVLLCPDDQDHDRRLMHLEPGEQLTIVADPDGMLIATRSVSHERWAVSRIRLQPASGGAPFDPLLEEASDRDAVFTVKDRRYRGSLEIWKRGVKELIAVNVLPLESYVDGVVAVEMKSSFPIEALKAQAICSRSYAYAMQLRFRAHQPYDLTDSLDDQDYRGTGHGNDVVSEAVRATRGLILTAKGRPFAPLYCASSGGHTTPISMLYPRATDMSGTVPLDMFMPGQPDDACKPAAEQLGYLRSHWETEAVLDPDEIKRRLTEWLRARGDDRQVGFINGITVVSRHQPSGRVEAVEVHHFSGPPIRMSGHEFRMMIGPNLVKSTLWSPESPRKQSNQATELKKLKTLHVIVCKGFGHGVGMSQISAVYLAKERRLTAAQILARFYPGAAIQRW